MAIVLLLISFLCFGLTYFCIVHDKGSLQMGTDELLTRSLLGTFFFIVGWTLFHGAMEVARDGSM